ncbi:MAG: tRNA epoxyqueuosine(34) reductase QueG, partial [Acidobacteriota bacterium]
MKGVVKRLARECGFELAGVAPPGPVPERLLPPARSVICTGKLYNTGADGRIVSRYAQGLDYHDVVRAGLDRLAARLKDEFGPFECKACVDTSPVPERALARRAGLGWIGKNTCLINQPMGSWFFLGELITSLDLEPDQPPPDRCGTCTRCIQACPTQALVPFEGRWTLDPRRCIAWLTIENRGEIPDDLRPLMGTRVFGCDICQEVCPWNRRAPLTPDPAFAPRNTGLGLENLAALDEDEFRRRFRPTPVWRTKHRGLMRNVKIALANSGR